MLPGQLECSERHKEGLCGDVKGREIAASEVTTASGFGLLLAASCMQGLGSQSQAQSQNLQFGAFASHNFPQFGQLTSDFGQSPFIRTGACLPAPSPPYTHLGYS